MRRTTIAAVAGLALALTACNDDGRTLAPAPPTSATVPETIPTTADPAAPVGMQLTSPDVADGELLAQRFTCDGLNVAPELVVSGVPPAAAELAVVVVDLDADGYVHWVVAGLAPTTARLAPGELPEGAVLATTDSGITGWDGPCPPTDDDAHRYEFRLHATAEPIGLSEGLGGRDAIAVIEAASIEVARLTARYASTAAG